MKKIAYTVVFLAFVSMSAMAQGRFSLGANLAAPVGDFGDAAGIGFGLSGRYEAGINENLTWNGTLGFLSFSDSEDLGFNYSMIPITGGLKYYFTENFNGFYAGADLGIYIVRAKGEFLGVDVDESDSEFGFAPGAGYHINNIDIQASFNLVGDADYFGIRVGYTFGAK